MRAGIFSVLKFSQEIFLKIIFSYKKCHEIQHLHVQKCEKSSTCILRKPQQFLFLIYSAIKFTLKEFNAFICSTAAALHHIHSFV